MDYFSFSRTPGFSKRTKRKIKQRPCTGYIKEITPKSPLLCVHRSHIRYGFRTGAKDIRCTVNTHPYHAENCHQSYVWIPWVPEAFNARFSVSVSLNFKKSDPREKLRRSWLRPSADKTKLPVAREKQPLVPRVMCEWKPHSEKEKNKEKNLTKTREITFSTKPQPSKSATPKPCVVLWGNNGYFFRFLLRHQLEALVQFITRRIPSLPRSRIF